MADGQHTYWQKTRQITALLLLIWCLIVFVVNWFARDFNTLQLFGFPLGFYFAAQGELLAFLLIVWIYNRRMNRLDREYGIDED